MDTMYSTWAIKVRIPATADMKEEPEPRYYHDSDYDDY